MKDFARIAAASPLVKPADPARNAAEIAKLMGEAAAAGADAAVFPELSVTGCTCGDLFFRADLLAEAETGLASLVAESGRCGHVLFVVGLPVRCRGRLFDCAAVFAAGRLLGVVPKSYPGDGPCGARWFAAAKDAPVREIDLAGFRVPFGPDLLFRSGDAVFGVAVGDDFAAPSAPSAPLALCGANVILNPCAPAEIAGGAARRRAMSACQSERLACALASAAAGAGESTTDYVFGGQTIVVENGEILAEGERLRREATLVFSDVDTGFLEFERSHRAEFRNCEDVSVREVDAPAPAPGVREGRPLVRKFDPHPFAPADPAALAAYCAETVALQASALATRLAAAKCRDAVIGVSGGLDSALALIVSVEAFALLGLDKAGIHAYTMPGFGTTSRTKGNAGRLCEGLGIEMGVADITATVRSHFADLGRDESVRDVTYENAQARARTFFLMDRANEIGALVVGTGDLSEEALGWCTYNGDHMSMYGVNAGVPKTLIRDIARWYAVEKCSAEAKEALLDILDTPVSPELLPATAGGEIAQKTEDKVGPYELHDFFLYHFAKRGADGCKIRALALAAFGGAYGEAEVDKWLGTFMRRFRTQQFKRSCSPDGPQVGPVSLSPRGGWTMPSDLG
jgi:NAD+ synthase (glutamine-hydrolysing)